MQSATPHTRRVLPHGKLSQRPEIVHVVPRVEPAGKGLRTGTAQQQELPWSGALALTAHTAQLEVVQRAKALGVRPAPISATRAPAPAAGQAAQESTATREPTAEQNAQSGQAGDHLVHDLQAVSASQASCSLDEVAAYRNVPHSTVQRALDRLPAPAVAMLGQAASMQTGAASTAAHTAQAALGKAFTDALPNGGGPLQQRDAMSGDAAEQAPSNEAGQASAQATPHGAAGAAAEDKASSEQEPTPPAASDALPAELPSQGSIYDMFMSMVGSRSPRAQRLQLDTRDAKPQHSSAPASPTKATGAPDASARHSGAGGRQGGEESAVRSESPAAARSHRAPSALQWHLTPSPLASSGPRRASDVASLSAAGEAGSGLTAAQGASARPLADQERYEKATRRRSSGSDPAGQSSNVTADAPHGAADPTDSVTTNATATQPQPAAAGGGDDAADLRASGANAATDDVLEATLRSGAQAKDQDPDPVTPCGSARCAPVRVVMSSPTPDVLVVRG